MGLFSNKKRSRKKNRSVNTIIGSDAVFEGVLQTKNSICIEGNLKGQLECEGQVILSKSGILEADVVAEYVSINGKVVGNITALKQLDIDATGEVHGNVKAAFVTVAKGGLLDGACNMLSESEAMVCRPSVSLVEKQLSSDHAKMSKRAEKSRDRRNGSLPKEDDTPEVHAETVPL